MMTTEQQKQSCNYRSIIRHPSQKHAFFFFNTWKKIAVLWIQVSARTQPQALDKPTEDTEIVAGEFGKKPLA